MSISSVARGVSNPRTRPEPEHLRGIGRFKVIEYKVAKRHERMDEMKLKRDWREEKQEYIDRYKSHIVKITNLRQENRQAMAEVTRLKIENAELRGLNQEAASHFTEMESSMQSAKDQVVADLADAKSRIDVLEHELASERNRVDELQTTKSDLEHELQRAKLGGKLSDQARADGEERLMMKIETTMAELVAKKKENHDLRISLRAAEATLEAQKIAGDAAQQQANTLRTTVSQFESRIIDLETTLGQTEVANSNMAAKASQASKELIAMSECEDAMTSANKVLMEMNSEMEERLLDVTERYQKLSIENEMNLERAELVSRLEQNTVDLQQKHDAVVQSHVGTVEALQQEIARLNQRLGEFEALSNFRNGVINLVNTNQ